MITKKLQNMRPLKGDQRFECDSEYTEIRDYEYWTMLGMYIRIARKMLLHITCDEDSLCLPENIVSKMRHVCDDFLKATYDYEKQAMEDLNPFIDTDDERKIFNSIFWATNLHDKFDKHIEEFLFITFHKKISGEFIQEGEGQ